MYSVKLRNIIFPPDSLHGQAHALENHMVEHCGVNLWGFFPFALCVKFSVKIPDPGLFKRTRHPAPSLVGLDWLRGAFRIGTLLLFYGISCVGTLGLIA